MECVNPNCKNRERLKQLFSACERDENIFKFCPFCNSTLRKNSTSDERKSDSQVYQAVEEASNITTEHLPEEDNVPQVLPKRDLLTTESDNQATNSQPDAKSEPLTQTHPLAENSENSECSDNQDVPKETASNPATEEKVSHEKTQPTIESRNDSEKPESSTPACLSDVNEGSVEGLAKSFGEVMGKLTEKDADEVMTLEESSEEPKLGSDLNTIDHSSQCKNHQNNPPSHIANNLTRKGSIEKTSVNQEVDHAMDKVPLHPEAVDQTRLPMSSDSTSRVSSEKASVLHKETSTLECNPILNSPAVGQHSTEKASVLQKETCTLESTPLHSPAVGQSSSEKASLLQKETGMLESTPLHSPAVGQSSSEKASLLQKETGMLESTPLHSPAVGKSSSEKASLLQKETGMLESTPLHSPAVGQSSSEKASLLQTETCTLENIPLYSTVVDQNSSTSKKEGQTMDMSPLSDDNRSSSTTRVNTNPTSDFHRASNRDHDVRLTTELDQGKPSNPEREVFYPPGHGLPIAQGPSILGAACIFGPDMPTNLTSDEIKTLSKNMDTANSQAESGKAAFVHHVVEESDTNSSSEEETGDYQVKSGPQPYDDDIIKQKRKERNNKRKRGPKATNKKNKTNEDGDNMEVDQQQIERSKYKPSETSQQATDFNPSHGHNQPSIQENVHQPKSGSGPGGTSSSPSTQQTQSHGHNQPSIQENVHQQKSGSGPGGTNSSPSTQQTVSHGHNQPSIQENVHQPKSGSGPGGTSSSPSTQQTQSHGHDPPSIQTNAYASPPNPNLTENVDCATIIFHALLSPDFNFKPNKQNVTVRIGNEELGGWNYNFADMFDVKKLDSNYFLVHGKIQLPVRFLYKPIPYKYVMVTGKQVDWEYSEFSDGHSSVIVDRSLTVVNNCRHPNAVWHQYDGVIYTEPKMGSSIWKFWTWGTTPKMDHAKLKKNREDACTLFLPKWRGFVTSSDSEPMTALEAIDSIKHLRECLLNPCICLGNKSIGKTVHFDFQKILKGFLKSKITHNVGLKEEDLKDPTVRTNRLISSLAITYLIWHFQLDLLYVQLTDIIHCLVLGSSGHERCDFDVVHMQFPDHTWGEISKAIVNLLETANRKSKSGNFCPDIILAVPLLHFFCKDTKPFDKCDDSDEAKSVQTWCHSKNFPQYKPHKRYIEAFFSKALPMFEMDPYFRRLFLYYVQYEDFPNVVIDNAFTEQELCMALGLRIKAETMLSTKMTEIEASLSCLTKRIKGERMQHYDKGTMRLAKSAFFLTTELFRKEVTSSKESFFTCIELVASSICSIQSPGHEHVSTECQATKRECEVIFSNLLTAVEIAITNDFFSGLNGYRKKQEIEVWTRLLNTSLVDRNSQEHWCQSLLSCFEKRLKKLTADDAIDLFCGMNSTDAIHLSLAEAITNHAFREVERSVESGGSEKSITALRKKCLQDVTQSRAGELLSRMLVSASNKQVAYSEITPHKQLKYIMNWKHWPVFISSFGSADNQKILTPDATKLVQRVIDHLGSIQHAIKNISIDVQTIVLLEQHQDNFRKLCDALTKIKIAESPGFIKTDMVMKELQKRSDELRHFKDLKSHVQDFLNMCRLSKEAIFDTAVLQERCETDISEMKLADICQRDLLSDEEQVSIIFFDLPDALPSDLPQLSSFCKSIIFQNFWKRNSRSSYKEKQNDNVPEEGGLTLLEIHKQVLQPSIESWKQLAKSVHDGSITLGEIDKHFKDTSDQDIGKELEMMFGLFKSTRRSTNRTIDERLKQIGQYRSLQKYIQAADTIWNFKEALGLKGDFETVKQLQNQTSKEFKEKTLTSIDGKFVFSARYLENISVEKAHCLSAVIDCEPLVKWLRETIKDTSALSTLVDLAMISAGENDMEVDRISNFHTSCLNFAPLIFDIHEDLGFDELMEACQPVWKSVESDERLPEKLSETCRHLEWLKAVQSSHGSVEMSSLMQTKMINSSGVYIVGNIPTSRDIKYGLESVLTLTVPMDERIQDPSRIEDQDIDLEGKEESKTYSLNDLKTLQSKLMLIAGKTVKLQHKDSIESTEEINRFIEIFEGVMRLGQVYMDLREAGDVKYLDWKEQVNCGEDTQFIQRHVGNKLAETCFEMEERLKHWRQYVHDRRRKFQELNHFTTKQILVLRRELGALRRDGASLNKLPLNVYSLLESVLNGISSYDLLEVLNTIHGFSLEAEPTESEMPPASDRENLESTNTENKYQTFFTTLGKMDYEEDVGIAALKAMDVLSTQDFNETDLIDWCMENGENMELITSLGEEAREDPDFIDFFPELKEEIQDDEQELQSEAMSSEEQNHSEDFPDLDVKQESYLSLDELGTVLANLAVKGARPTERRFPDYLKNDQPNLILVQSDDLFQTVLTLYKQYGGESLPTPNEVLLCTSDTTAEEVELFWWRAYQDMHKQIFCLVNPDVLDYSVSQTSVNMFNVLKQKFGASKECRIVVVCSTENEDRSHIIAALDEYRVHATPSCASGDILKLYLADQLTCSNTKNGYYKDEKIDWHPASYLDTDKLSVRVVSSNRAGVGKTLVVTRLCERLMRQLPNNAQMSKLRKPSVQLSVTVPLHGTVADTRQILDALWQHPVEANLPVSRIIHLDVSPSINEGLETVLFNLIVLGVLQDKTGRLWRRRSSDLYVIEMTNPSTKVTSDSQKISFVSLFPMIDCITPIQTLQCLRTSQDAKIGPSPLFDSDEFKSVPVQRAFQYLLQCDRDQSLDRYQYDSRKHMGTPFECLALIIKYCGISHPSWSELKHFIDFLNSQLQDCEESYYTNAANFDDQWMQGTLKGFKSFVVRFMVTMSRDFATPSLDDNPVVCSAGLSAVDIDEDIRPLQLRRRWESSPHPYIFFNQDRITMTFLGFNVNATGDLIDPGTGIVIERGLLTKQLQSGLALQKVDFNTDYNKWTKMKRIEQLCMVMDLKKAFDPDTSYELTIDNMKKILAIHMRFRCGIPVVIMGETGCGKTRLIRYMCALQAGSTGQRNMLLMKVHGGTSYEDITRKVEQAEEMAKKNEKKGIDTVLFFDEANTTDALGMIKEVMVDRRVNGRPVGVGMRRLHFIAACNPYRRHTDNMIDKLESAGLGYSVKANETKDKLGKIPLRHLVYRVHALPASMRPLVWDFGQLKPEIEELYICQIVRRYIVVECLIPGNEGLVKATARVLAAAQKYMRQQQDECSFVSLRDVERAMTVMTWFYQHRANLRPQAPRRGSDDEDSSDSADELQQRMDMVTWSLLLSLGVCYHAKLQNRKPFRESVIRACISPLKPIGQKEMLNEIDRCQKVLIDELSLGPNIARNKALSENVFMMVVCIELRIPLFVIGKPGSSKSLAKTVVADNMQGDASKSPLFKKFKRAHMVSYQCSPLSTPEGIVATFRQCRRLQENNPGDRYASVVVLDEVGLAEDSPLLPLKTLHPLLEDGVTSSDDIIETDEKPTRVAFIGISNWALDPAKMNRGLMLMRGEPNKKELEDSAWGICAAKEQIRNMLSTLLKHLAAGYADLYKQQKNFKSLSSSKRDEFFGLRDFYSLVKMVYSIAAEKREMLVWSELEHAIRRNFGGLDEIDAVKIFAKHVKSSFWEVQDGEPVKTLDLLRASLDHKNAIGESRYLLVITENYSALSIVEQELNKNKDDYVVIFGSSFPKDQEYTQVCRNINQIKVCMETGRTVVLLNLESLYESLYDALNQYYVYCAGQKYVDLGLGSHRVKCRVDDTFRLIVIAEKDVVYKKFPIPLINRLEKHYLVTSKSLGRAQLGLVEDLNQWAQNFAEIHRQRHERQQKFHIGDAFIGYQSDTLPSMVLQVCGRDTTCDYDHLGSWAEQVKKECQSLLVECATPDAIVRLPKTLLRDKADDVQNVYFVEQEHSSLSAYLSRLLTRTSLVEEDQNGLLVQVSTHSRLLSENDLNDICQSTRFHRRDVKLLHLQQFQTEQQFTKQIREFFIELSNNEGMMLVQCDSGDENFNLIACTRHLLIDQCNKRQEMLIDKLQVQSIRPLHVVVIVQLPRLEGGCTSFVGFQGGRWNSVHVDDLRPQVLPIESSIGRPISDLLKPSWITDDSEMSEQEQDPSLDDVDIEMNNQEEEEIEIDDDEIEDAEPEKNSKETFDAVVLLRRSIQAAAGRLEDEVLTKRTTDRIDMVLNLLPENSSKIADGPSFAKSLHQKIYELLVEKNVRVSGSLASQWVLNEALSGTRMHERGTFRKALQYKVLSEIEPLLAKILAFVDRDRNLDLLVNQSPWLVRLWVHIFENKHLNEKYFDVSDTNMIREHVNVSGRGRHVFHSRFPFSWLIKDMVDGLARGAADVSNRSCEKEEEKLRSILGNSDLSDIFDLLKEEGKEEEATKRYLHDFVHMVYFPTKQCQQEEIELVSRYIMMTAEKESDQEGYIFDIATIHVTFNRVESRINNFNKLIQTQPEVTRILLDQKRPMSIDVAALIVFLEKLEPRMSELKHAETRNDWCGTVLTIRSSIEEMTSKVVFSRQSDDSGGYEESEKELLKHCWMMWQRLSVIRIFITHVCNTSLQETECLQYLKTLTKVLDDNINFLRVRSVISLERFLLQCSQDFKCNKTCDTVCSICIGESKCPSLSPCGHCFCLECITRWITDNGFCPKCRVPLPDDFTPTESTEIKSACDNINQFRDHCNSFFMEVVSLFCFGYSPCGSLEGDTFKRLMSYVTGQEDAQTKPFSPFSDTMDVTPVVRSFLLQQLLKNSDTQVKEYMEDFIQRAQEVVQVELSAAEVFVMCIQCMEDAHSSKFFKRTSELQLVQKLNLIEITCKKASSTAARIHGNNNLDVGWLEGIAIIRFSLTLAADLMYQFVQGDEEMHRPNQQRTLRNIFDEVQKICCRPSFTRPRLFLLKQLSRRYGFESIHFVAKTFQWILPEELTESFEVSQDQFLVYGRQYQNLRETIARSVVNGDMEAIGDVIQNMTWGGPLKNVALLLTLFHEITANPSVQIADAVMTKLHTFIQQSTLMNDGCKHLAEELITEDHQDQRTLTSIFGLAGEDPWQTSMVKIIIHLAVVLRARRQDGILGPLAALAYQPDSCINSFLPTMPEDTNQEIRAVLGGAIHECPNGHPYIITECGRPMERTRCKASGCGADIGGDNHRLVSGNRASDTADQTRKGHCLGFPANREGQAIPERGLSPLATCLVRLLVHGSMLIGSCYHIETVSQLITPNIPPNNVPRFLWEHLLRDMNLLSRASGRSVDDTSLTVHLLLENILISNSMNVPHGLGVLRDKNQRGQWEKYFSTAIITPLMSNLVIRVQQTTTLIANDERFGANPLLRQLYELEAGVEDPSRSIEPDCTTLWRYRTPITLDNVTRKFNESADTRSADSVILGEFLKQERELRAVKFLPDVVRLQRLLMDRYHRSLDRTETDKLRLRDFYKKIPKGSLSEYKSLVQSFRSAWNIMVASERAKGTKGPIKKLSENEVNDDSPISMFIPAISGLGACSLALVRFLVDTHNDFLEIYRQNSDVRDLPHVSLLEVTCSQLVSYDTDRDLLPLVHAHCHYSLEIGQGTSVEYDWSAVQRHLIDRLIRGRSVIDFKADEYTKTAVVNAESVLTSLKAKIPQTELTIAIQHQIIQQYRSLQDVCEALSSLKIAITFLSSGGGRQDMSMTKYLHEVLKLPEDAGLRNHKVKEVCQLQHTVSLWRLLSIERARLLTRNVKDPFEHLSDDFKTPVAEKLQMTVRESLRKLNDASLDALVALLIEIITLQLNEELDINKECSLKDYIEYNPLYKDDEVPSDVEHIPDDVQLQHVFGFWQIVISLSDKCHQRRIQATG